MKEQNVKDGTGKKKKHFFFLLPLVFCLLTLVTGCVQYDVGVNFESQTRERPSSFAQERKPFFLLAFGRVAFASVIQIYLEEEQQINIPAAEA